MLLRDYIREQAILNTLRYSEPTAESSVLHILEGETKYSRKELEEHIEALIGQGRVHRAGYSLFLQDKG